MTTTAARTSRSLGLGEVLRYPSYSIATLDMVAATEFLSPDTCGHRNFYWVTYSTAAHDKPARLEKGISPVRDVGGPDGIARKPAILLRTSGHKAGSEQTPWHDHIDLSGGAALYYGDKRPDDGKVRPDEATGNRALLSQTLLHRSSSRGDRLRAAPLLTFTAQVAEGSQKGHVRFEGAGVITRTELVSQTDRQGRPFANYRIESALISLAKEGEVLSWDWIDARRDRALTMEETLAFAPDAWKRWVDGGDAVLGRVRYRIALPPTRATREQLPDSGSREDQVLSEIIKYYMARKGRFEALAARVMEERLRASGAYHAGWLTRPSGDGGYDMVGRLDLGEGTRPVQLVVLGQAKCVSRTGTSAEQLARLVARLRRGWFGVFVTTGYFSTAAQVELIRDEYPVMLVAGRQVAETVYRMAIAETGGDVSALLDMVDAGYEDMVRDLDANQVLMF